MTSSFGELHETDVVCFGCGSAMAEPAPRTDAAVVKGTGCAEARTGRSAGAVSCFSVRNVRGGVSAISANLLWGPTGSMHDFTVRPYHGRATRINQPRRKNRRNLAAHGSTVRPYHGPATRVNHLRRRNLAAHGPYGATVPRTRDSRQPPASKKSGSSWPYGATVPRTRDSRQPPASKKSGSSWLYGATVPRTRDSRQPPASKKSGSSWLYGATVPRTRDSRQPARSK